MFSQQTGVAELQRNIPLALEHNPAERRHSPGVARGGADDVDRGALDADLGGHVLDDDAQEPEERRDARVVRGAQVLAAADRASVAAPGALRDGCGGRKSGEDGGGEERELGEHGGRGWFGVGSGC